jgi:hypothetical protein
VEGDRCRGHLIHHFATFAGAATLYMEELIGRRVRAGGRRAVILYLARLALDEGFF